MLTGVGQKGANLTILNAAGRAALLAFDANQVRAPLEETGLVDDQHGLRVAEVVNDVFRSSSRTPAASQTARPSRCWMP